VKRIPAHPVIPGLSSAPKPCGTARRSERKRSLEHPTSFTSPHELLPVARTAKSARISSISERRECNGPAAVRRPVPKRIEWPQHRPHTRSASNCRSEFQPNNNPTNRALVSLAGTHIAPASSRIFSRSLPPNTLPFITLTVKSIPSPNFPVANDSLRDIVYFRHYEKEARNSRIHWQRADPSRARTPSHRCTPAPRAHRTTAAACATSRNPRRTFDGPQTASPRQLRRRENNG